LPGKNTLAYFARTPVPKKMGFVTLAPEHHGVQHQDQWPDLRESQGLHPDEKRV
jgi:hypothetical protein